MESDARRSSPALRSVARASSEKPLRFGHWLGGRERFEGPVAFERQAGGRRFLAPRAGRGVIREALELGWPARGARGVAARVAERWLDELCRFGAWTDDLEDALGLARGSLEEELDDLTRRPAEPIGPPAPPARAVLLVGHWSHLVGDLVGEVQAAWARGAGVLLCSDGRLAPAAHALGEAAAASEVPGDRLTVLHGALPAEVLDELPDAAGVVVRGRLESGSERTSLVRAVRSTGASAEELEVPHASEARVGPHEDPRRAAERAVRELGPWPRIGGQRTGTITRWRIHPRGFAAFTEALLDRLEADPPAPVPAFDRAARRAFEDALRLALGEGATLIHGSADGEAAFGPAVVTNCEDHMTTLADPVPRPLLRLARGAGSLV